jgi:S-adenosylmethionine decarboxylase
VFTLRKQRQSSVPAFGEHLGKHCLLDLMECDALGVLNSAGDLERLLRGAASAAGASVVGALRHQFKPQGASAVLLLAESHVSIHTWPELGSATVDMYTCGDVCDPVAGCMYIVGQLRPKDYVLTRVTRGSEFPPSNERVSLR